MIFTLPRNKSECLWKNLLSMHSWEIFNELENLNIEILLIKVRFELLLKEKESHKEKCSPLHSSAKWMCVAKLFKLFTFLFVLGRTFSISKFKRNYAVGGDLADCRNNQDCIACKLLKWTQWWNSREWMKQTSTFFLLTNYLPRKMMNCARFECSIEHLYRFLNNQP